MIRISSMKARCCRANAVRQMAILKAQKPGLVKRNDEEMQKQTAVPFPLEGVVAAARWASS